MRILLVALNSKYVHTNLALRYLREAVKPEFPGVMLKEFTINERIDSIAGEIYEAKADVIGFSCYIWNLTEVLAVIRYLKPVCPATRFVLGGPEVSFDAASLLDKYSEIDAVVAGEGEHTFPELLRAYQTGVSLENVNGVAWRREGVAVANPARFSVTSLSELPSPYGTDESFAGRLVYVETTRGCPFSCQYCLSSTLHGVRYMEAEDFRRLFSSLLQMGARTIKFVDRTFNVKKEHAFRILDIAREETKRYDLDGKVRVHCEIAGELLDEDWLAYLADYPAGLVQMEIGVQSTHQPTLEIIQRPQHFDRWKGYVREIRETGKVPVHLDLIAGLPGESWEDFRISFNDVYVVRPDMLQMGFLKVLKGSGIRELSAEYGLAYTPDPPYTILQTNVLSHAELLQLHRLEEILEKYYNSGKFKHSMEAALKLFPTPFDFYHGFAEYWHEHGWFKTSWQGKALFDKLWEFLEAAEYLRDFLRFDYYLWERPNVVPDYLQPEMPGSQLSLDSTSWVDKIPESKEMDRRQWARATALAYFSHDVLAAKGGKPAGSDPGVWYLFFYRQGKAQAFLIE